MNKTIVQKVRFHASPAVLYGIYMNSKKHAAAIDSSYVSVQNRVGGRFSAFTMLSGKFLVLKKNKMIVQTWRSKNFKKKDLDSILVLHFHKVKGGTVLEMVHAGIPDHDYPKIRRGWPVHYWGPLRKYLKASKR